MPWNKPSLHLVPRRRGWIKELSTNLFLFQFFHELDVDRVEKGKPWTFNKQLLMLKRMEKGMKPLNSPINSVTIWVQIHEVPFGFHPNNVAHAVGKNLGKFIEADPWNEEGAWNVFLRVRVELDARKPLVQRMKIKAREGEWSWVYFKYERLPSFYYNYGRNMRQTIQD